MPEPLPALAAKLELVTERPGVFLLTGWIPGCGASFLAANLARTLAGLGRRVHLLDANLRRPKQARIHGVDEDEGLVDALIDVPVAGLLCEPAGPGLRMLPAGPRPPSPEELLASPRLEGLLTELRAVSDAVLLDGPSLEDGADVLLLARAVDGVLLVVPADVSLQDLEIQLEEWKDLGVELVGVVCGAEAPA